jgi:assimilatory nitrate reductase catalytic subunit
VQNALGTINLVLASGRIGKPNAADDRRPGQRAGGREHGLKCDQLPGWRDISNPEHRAYIAGVWGIDEPDLPGPGVDAYEMFRKIDAGEIKGLLSICFNPKVSLPDNAFVTRCLEKLEFYTAIDFFLNDTARHADIILPGSLHEEDEGTVTQVECRVIKVKRLWIAWVSAAGLADHPGSGPRARPPARIHLREPARDLRGAAHRQQGRRRRLLRDHLREDRGADGRLLAVLQRRSGDRRAAARSPGDAAPLRARHINPVAKEMGRSIFQMASTSTSPNRPPVDDASEEYPIFLTTGRVVSQFLSGTQTRRIGPLVNQYPEPRIEIHPRLAAKLGIEDGDWATAETRRGTVTLRAMVVTTIRPDTIFIPYHWPGEKSPNRLTVAAQDPISKIPQYKVCGCRVRKADGPPAYAAVLEPQQ